MDDNRPSWLRRTPSGYGIPLGDDRSFEQIQLAEWRKAHGRWSAEKLRLTNDLFELRRAARAVVDQDRSTDEGDEAFEAAVCRLWLALEEDNELPD